jgi:hypothetical protein
MLRMRYRVQPPTDRISNLKRDDFARHRETEGRGDPESRLRAETGWVKQASWVAASRDALLAMTIPSRTFTTARGELSSSVVCRGIEP